jgi:hypothetical protein
MEATATWRILVATVPSIGMMGSYSPPLVRSGGDDGMEEPGGEEPLSIGFR